MINKLKIFGTLAIIMLNLSCSPQKDSNTIEGRAQDFYLRFSPATEPGEYATLFDGLPQSYGELCSLIKKQLIHPLEAREMENILPDGRIIG
jgi:hypothetical protein